MSNSVKVAVRVRPFTAAEKALDDRPCVYMQDNTTVLYKGSEKRQFTYDFSLWSHDGFVEDEETGALCKDTAESKYADQFQVFEDVGGPVLNNALQGYNACVFAYGQTGSGKSYTMVGDEANSGLIPMMCKELFTAAEERKATSVNTEVSVSIFEIYNEKLTDLLHPSTELTLRDTPAGVWVDGLDFRPVADYFELEEVMEQGNARRTIAATAMNDHSSRAHTVYRLQVTMQTKEGVLTSEINLVDLAGSERVGEVGAEGIRFEEGTKINLSLSTLRGVIAALTSSHPHIPYRDSVLTFVLKNALGGNSRTAMIATISPAAINYSQTLSTLRYAQQVKYIENSAVVNLATVNPEAARLKNEIVEAKGQLRKREALIQELSLELVGLREKIERDLNDRTYGSRDTLTTGRTKSSVKRSCACQVF